MSAPTHAFLNVRIVAEMDRGDELAAAANGRVMLPAVSESVAAKLACAFTRVLVRERSLS